MEMKVSKRYQEKEKGKAQEKKRIKREKGKKKRKKRIKERVK